MGAGRDGPQEQKFSGSNSHSPRFKYQNLFSPFTARSKEGTLTYPKTAIISDLHGNTPALQVAIEHALSEGVERFVCLGDVVGYGAHPRECLDVAMRLCVPKPTPFEFERPHGGEGELAPGLCLQGNHEFALLHSAEDFNPRARAAIDWTREQFNEVEDEDDRARYWEFLSGLAPKASDGVAMFAHGSPRDPVREYMLPRDIHDADKLRENFEEMDAGVCFVGHSHVPAVYYEDRRFFQPQGTQGPYDLGDLERARAIVNVGSIGQPRDRDPRLCYVIFTGTALTFVRLEYDVAQTQADIRAIPALPDELAERLSAGR